MPRSFLFLKPRQHSRDLFCSAQPTRPTHECDKTHWLMLNETKTGHGFQLLRGFKQEPAAHTLLAFLVSLSFH